MRFKIDLWAHQLKALENSKPERDYALLFDMGCLAGDALIKTNTGGCSRERRIEDLYRLWNRVDLRPSETGITKSITKIRSLKDERIGLHKIDKVYKSGIKEVYALKVRGNPALKVTVDHKILTKRGWIRAEDLKADDYIACDALTKHQKKKKSEKTNYKKPRYSVINVGKFHPYAHQTTHRGKVIYRIEKHRAIYEAHLNKISLAEFQEKTFSKNSLKYINPKKWHIHHKDHDPKNNDISNLEKMDPSKHLAMHNKGYVNFGHGNIVWKKLLSFKKVGKEMTYDISCKAPYHNFVANGIVVHNSGKTATVINMLRYKCFQHGRQLKTLVLAPVTILENWRREFDAHSNMGEKAYVLNGPIKKRLETMDKAIEKHGACIFIINYDVLAKKEILDKFLDYGFEVVISDESQRLKNIKAKRTQAAIKIADRALHRYILTGTPILNNPMDIFAQFRFLDKGATFGRNFWEFRSQYFWDKNDPFKNTDNYFPDWRPRKGIEEIFYKKIYKKAMRVLKDDCMDLPPFVKQRVEVPLSPEQNKAYTQMLKLFVAYLQDEKACIAELAITKSLRLQQILSGYAMPDESDKPYIFDKNPRLDALKETIESLPEDAKFIVWATFRPNYDLITRLLDKIGISWVRLVGGLNDKERQENIDSFQAEGGPRAMVANQGAGGVGVNLTAASYSLYFSRSYNLEHDLQSEARNYRGGSEIHKKVTRIDIVAPGTIDELILESLHSKHSQAEAILAWTKKLTA